MSDSRGKLDFGAQIAIFSSFSLQRALQKNFIVLKIFVCGPANSSWSSLGTQKFLEKSTSDFFAYVASKLAKMGIFRASFLGPFRWATGKIKTWLCGFGANLGLHGLC